MELNSEYSKEKQEFLSKEQAGGWWIENYLKKYQK